MFTQTGPKIFLAFADDIYTIDTNTMNVNENFARIEKESRKVGLRINEDQTKYTYVYIENNTKEI